MLSPEVFVANIVSGLARESIRAKRFCRRRFNHQIHPPDGVIKAGGSMKQSSNLGRGIRIRRPVLPKRFRLPYRFLEPPARALLGPAEDSRPGAPQGEHHGDAIHSRRLMRSAIFRTMMS